VLGDAQNRGSGVAGNVTGEDGRINNEEIVGTVHLGVGVDDGAASSASIVGAHLDGADPVVGVTGASSGGDLRGLSA